MNFLIAENPRKKRTRKAHKKSHKRTYKRHSPKRKAGKGGKRHQAYRATTVRPVLHRTRKGVFRATPTARRRRRAAHVRMYNPGRRRHYARRNPVFSTGGVMSTVKTAGGVLAVNAITNQLFGLLGTTLNSVTTDATTQKLLKNAAKIGVAYYGGKAAKKWIGESVARDIVTFVSVLVALDLLTTYVVPMIPGLDKLGLSLGRVQDAYPLQTRVSGVRSRSVGQIVPTSSVPFMSQTTTAQGGA